MISYYAVYEQEVGEGPPRGIIITDERTGDAIVWNHQTKAWRYDPELAGRWMDDPDNWDRYKPVDRAEAEIVTMVVTRAQEALPDEDTIGWLFRTKGRPSSYPDLSDQSSPPRDG
jgi:hypothetical protein